MQKLVNLVLGVASVLAGGTANRIISTLGVLSTIAPTTPPLENQMPMTLVGLSDAERNNWASIASRIAGGEHSIDMRTAYLATINDGTGKVIGVTDGHEDFLFPWLKGAQELAGEVTQDVNWEQLQQLTAGWNVGGRGYASEAPQSDAHFTPATAPDYGSRPAPVCDEHFTETTDYGFTPAPGQDEPHLGGHDEAPQSDAHFTPTTARIIVLARAVTSHMAATTKRRGRAGGRRIMVRAPRQCTMSRVCTTMKWLR